MLFGTKRNNGNDEVIMK